MFDPKKFTTPAAKPLPVVLLLDVSGSMYGSKIDNLNKAVSDMLETLAEEEKMETEFLVSIITFGSDVKLHTPYTKTSQIQWQSLQSSGMTPMGAALKMAKSMIEDKETTLGRFCIPTVVLISDGQPNDSWEKPLEDFISKGRSSKCFCWAMGIGSDAYKDVLEQFISKTPYLADKSPNRVFTANEAKDIHKFFQQLTMSLLSRSRSQNPNAIPASIEVDETVASKISVSVIAEDEDQGYW